MVNCKVILSSKRDIIHILINAVEFFGTSVTNRYVCVCGLQRHTFAYGMETKCDQWIISCIGTLWSTLAKIFCLVILIAQSNDDYLAVCDIKQDPKRRNNI